MVLGFSLWRCRDTVAIVSFLAVDIISSCRLKRCVLFENATWLHGANAIWVNGTRCACPPPLPPFATKDRGKRMTASTSNFPSSLPEVPLIRKYSCGCWNLKS